MRDAASQNEQEKRDEDPVEFDVRAVLNSRPEQPGNTKIGQGNQGVRGYMRAHQAGLPSHAVAVGKKIHDDSEIEILRRWPLGMWLLDQVPANFTNSQIGLWSKQVDQLRLGMLARVSGKSGETSMTLFSSSFGFLPIGGQLTRFRCDS